MRKAILVLLVASLGVGFAACDLLDPTNVENPDITEENALNTPNPLRAWKAGLDRQLAITLNNTLIIAELGTDNYVNTQTFFNQSFDALDIRFNDSDIDDAFFTMNDLRESALFGKNTVAPGDPDARPDDLAELDFYLGLSHLYLGEYFHSAPLEGSGTPATSQDHFNAAVTALTDAVESGNGDQTAYKLALARAYYNQGNVSQASDFATQVLAEDDEFVRNAEFDGNNGPTNTLQDALYDRSTFDDFQPLPRLDFLDPKYYDRGPNNESPVAILKAEEAHLILIEAALADGNLSQAQDQMKDLIALVDSRPVEEIDETEEGRTEDDPGSRPDTSSVVVRASSDDPFRSGLVLDRTAQTPVPTVSGTSVTESRVDNISNADEAWEVYYLMRQEIFIAEGRRIVDFGIKLPLPENELLINDAVEEGPAIEPIIPSFIDGQPLNEFTYDADAGEATIAVNMNRVLANNRSSVSPLLQ